ncbi:hypothetical protein [Haladaptatus sp. NG-WS-4]
MRGDPEIGPGERARMVREAVEDSANRSVEVIATDYPDPDSTLARRLAVADAGRLVHVPEAGHCVFRDRYDAAYAELCAFLRRV